MYSFVCVMCSVVSYTGGDCGLLRISQLSFLIAQVTIRETNDETVEDMNILNLSGRWKAVSGELEGKEISKDEISESWVEFSDGKMSLGPRFVKYQLARHPGEPKAVDVSKDQMAVTINSTCVPAELDITVGFSGRQIVTPFGTWKKGKPLVQKCIYECADDQLTICFGNTNERPDQFSTANNRFKLIKYERDNNSKVLKNQVDRTKPASEREPRAQADP